MEAKLQGLFDFQRFQSNERLDAIIDDVAFRYANALTDDDLELVSAAGEAALPARKPEDTDDE